jgi:hypothetical protein
MKRRKSGWAAWTRADAVVIVLGTSAMSKTKFDAQIRKRHEYYKSQSFV